jgi:hypothetical protein
LLQKKENYPAFQKDPIIVIIINWIIKGGRKVLIFVTLSNDDGKSTLTHIWLNK